MFATQYYSYPGFLIYAQATYAFYALSIAIVNMVKYLKMERPILSAAVVISFACALTSIMALQAAMLVQFGDQEKSFMMLMNSLTGGTVCSSVFVLAIWLVHKTRKEMRVIEN